MNGLINRSIQCFVRDTYGEDRWKGIARAVGIGVDGYEMLLDYPDDETDRLVAIAASDLGQDTSSFLEDVGTYLVSHETTRGVRRLLRFCGDTFTEFLYALYDLPSRAHLAMPGLVIPELEVREDPPGQFRVFVLTDRQGWGDVVLGLLRAMADDYGALVLMERGAGTGAIAVIEVKLLDGRFAEGRDFALIDDGKSSRHSPTKAPERNDLESATLHQSQSSGEESSLRAPAPPTAAGGRPVRPAPFSRMWRSTREAGE